MQLNPTVIFSPSEVPVTEEQITAFETKIGFHLPSDYRAFLKLYNGAKMRPVDPQLDPDFSHLCTDLSDYPDIPNLERFDVASWLGFADPDATYRYGLLEQTEVVNNEWSLPKGIIPIGVSVGPGKVFLNLASGSRYNHILLVGDTVVDRQAQELPIGSEHFVSVAASFTDFVSKLRWVTP